MIDDDEKCGNEGKSDVPSEIIFESLASISARLPVRRAMHSSIYDQADTHRSYVRDGIGDGPSPELIEQSLHRMAERGTVPSIDQDGSICERTVYVASIDQESLERKELQTGVTTDSEDDRITVYSDDGLDVIPGSHDVFELINDLENLFLKISALSLYDAGFVDPYFQQLIILERKMQKDVAAEPILTFGSDILERRFRPNNYVITLDEDNGKDKRKPGIDRILYHLDQDGTLETLQNIDEGIQEIDTVAVNHLVELELVDVLRNKDGDIIEYKLNQLGKRILNQLQNIESTIDS